MATNEMKAYVVASIQRDLDTMKAKGWMSDQSYSTIMSELNKGSSTSLQASALNAVNPSGKIAVPVAAPLAGHVPAQFLPNQVEVDTQVAIGVAGQAAHLATMERVKGLYDYEAQQAGDLSFKTGDVIEVVSKESSEWWTGRLNGKQGSFPVNYVEVLKTYLATGRDAAKASGAEALKNSGNISSFAKGKIF